MKKIVDTILILSVFLLTSCVGTVEQGVKTNSVTTKEEKSSVLFQGIYKANAISNDKVELFFYPATGASGKYTYVVYNSASPDPTYYPSEVLSPDYRGLNMITITGLDGGEDYTFRIDVEDQASKEYTKTDVTSAATTFTNRVADFAGISSVANLQGEDGLDSISVRWVHATKSSSVLGTQPYDPIRYEITVIDLNKLKPDSFHNDTLGNADGRYIKYVQYSAAVNQVDFRGLPSGTDFYVTVRAIHKNSINDINSPNLRGEMNSKYLAISTLSADLASIQFDQASLKVTAGEGERAKDTAYVEWGDAIGAFDHFRIYYALDSVGLSTSSITDTCTSSLDGTGVSCKKTRFDANLTTLANLKQSSDYNIMLVICQTTTCEEGKRIVTPMVLHSTLPSIASFTGLQEIKLARNISEIGQMRLKFDLPDFSEGYFDGYMIGFKATQDEVGTAFDRITETDYNGDLVVEEYDYKTAVEITISGVNYDSNDVYCFQVYPFIYASDGSKIEYTNNVWKCDTPEIITPSIDLFPGLSQASVNKRSILLSWNAPAEGIFDIYYIFMRKTSGSFDFSQAINQAYLVYDFTDYDVYWAYAWESTITIPNLPNGLKKFGILTNFANDSGNYWSEFNMNIYKCTVDGTTIEDCEL